MRKESFTTSLVPEVNSITRSNIPLKWLFSLFESPAEVPKAVHQRKKELISMCSLRFVLMCTYKIRI